jgi:hypothetical protein
VRSMSLDLRPPPLDDFGLAAGGGLADTAVLRSHRHRGRTAPRPERRGATLPAPSRRRRTESSRRP